MISCTDVEALCYIICNCIRFPVDTPELSGIPSGGGLMPHTGHATVE